MEQTLKCIHGIMIVAFIGKELSMSFKSELGYSQQMLESYST